MRSAAIWLMLLDKIREQYSSNISFLKRVIQTRLRTAIFRMALGAQNICSQNCHKNIYFASESTMKRCYDPKNLQTFLPQVFPVGKVARGPFWSDIFLIFIFWLLSVQWPIVLKQLSFKSSMLSRIKNTVFGLFIKGGREWFNPMELEAWAVNVLFCLHP